METVRIKIQLHPKQFEFRRSAALYRGFVGGRGSGKSWAGAYDLIRRLRPERTYLVGSPTGVLLGDTTFPTFKKLATDFGIWGGVKLTPYPNATILLDGGEATIRFRTAEDPDKMRGPNLSGVWLDEASLMEEEAYTISIAALREAGEQGWLSATFTPKGPFHWTYETFARGKPDTAIFRAHTRENPFNPPGFAETLAKQYGPQFARQELGGEFVETEGAEWPAIWFSDNLWFRNWPQGMTLRVIALDPSKGKNAKQGDYSAFVLLARDGQGNLWVEADLERRTTDRIVADGLCLAKRLATETGGVLDGLGCESDQFQELLADQFVTQSKAAGVPVPLYKLTTGGVPKEVRIRRLTPYLSQGQFRFRDTPGTRLLVQQLQTFPVGDYDDGPDAMEYALRLAIHLWNGKPRKVQAR